MKMISKIYLTKTANTIASIYVQDVGKLFTKLKTSLIANIMKNCRKHYNLTAAIIIVIQIACVTRDKYTNDPTDGVIDGFIIEVLNWT